MSESPRVLVIDDEPAICELIEAVAESAGFSVRTASSPAEIEESIQGRFDLVVLDLSLGELDGIEVMSRLGTTHRGLPVILVSGADETLITTAGRIAEMHRLRVIATFAKPFSLDLLRSAMLEWTHVANERIDPTGPRLRIDDEALFDPEFMHLVYQPKVSVSTGDVVGVEALVRWRHPDKGDVSPAAYVALVEDLGRTSELLDAIMTMAAHDRFRYRALASMPDVSLNISVLDLDDDELPRRAQRILTTTSPAESWTFEVTETTPIPDLTPTVAVLTRLRLAGFKLAVDDFGTGTSNYERLLVAPFTELKIDRAMVSRLDASAAEPDAMVRSGVDVGHSLGLQVVAEGVETVEQFTLIRSLGCDAVQGYFVSAPVKPVQIDAALDRWAENFEVLGLDR
ncbi:MAG: EAL domain-containing protein [Actinobacteria bacterium]|nr:EAL domain-containing protein [Actinomycetota bacterium]